MKTLITSLCTLAIGAVVLVLVLVFDGESIGGNPESKPQDSSSEKHDYESNTDTHPSQFDSQPARVHVPDFTPTEVVESENAWTSDPLKFFDKSTPTAEDMVNDPMYNPDGISLSEDALADLRRLLRSSSDSRNRLIAEYQTAVREQAKALLDAGQHHEYDYVREEFYPPIPDYSGPVHDYSKVTKGRKIKVVFPINSYPHLRQFHYDREALAQEFREQIRPFFVD